MSRTLQQEYKGKGSTKPNVGDKYGPGHPRFIKGSRNIISQPFMKTFFGIGNHYYPQSRASIGIWVIEEWANQYSLTFDEEPDLQCATTGNELCTLVRPQSYNIENNNRSLYLISHSLQCPLDRVVMIHHDEKLDFGTVQLAFGGHVRHNAALCGIKEMFNTEKYGRIAVGVGHPHWKGIQGRYLPTWDTGDHEYNNRFLQNKFPPNEMLMMKHIVMPKIFEVMDVAMKCQHIEEYDYAVTLSYKEVEEQYEEFLKMQNLERKTAERIHC